MKNTIRTGLLLIALVVSAVGAMMPALRAQAGDCPGVKCNFPSPTRYANTEDCLGDMYANGGCNGSLPNMKCNPKSSSQPWTDCAFGSWEITAEFPGGHWKLGGDTCRCHTFNGEGNLTLASCDNEAIPANCE